jgi:hypothetical protein
LGDETPPAICPVCGFDLAAYFERLENEMPPSDELGGGGRQLRAEGR